MTDLALAHKRHAIKVMASKFKQADPSDPFAYNRIYTHLTLGVGQLSEYKCDFKSEYRVTPRGEKYAVQVPCNIVRGA